MSERRTDRRRALVVGPSFFGYEHDIVSELERQGFATDFLDERPSNSSVARAILRVRTSLIAHKVDEHFRAAAERLAGATLDLVLVIKAEVVPRWFLLGLRAANPSARFVFYTYDSLKNAGNCRAVLDLFDTRFSFDAVDVASHGDEFGYLPLFYAREFEVGELNEPRRWLLSFVGTLHSDRYRIVKRASSAMPSSFVWFFVQARWYFLVVKYVTREHSTVPWGEVAFEPMTRAAIAQVFRQSKAVLDVQRVGQSGLTMRTFEVLASGAILVTTNAAIVGEPFYDPARVIVLPADARSVDPLRVKEALDARETLAGPPKGFEAYSLSAWVRTVVGD